jgi:hypothetical protein
MKKLSMRSMAFVILGIVFMVIILIHSLAANKTNSIAPDRAKLVKMILDEASDDDSSQRFLIISKYVCRTCFESTLEKLGNDAEMSRKIAIILIGANNYETKMMNTIYRKLNFKSIDEALYKKIEQIDVNFAEGAFVGVRKSASGAITSYDGESDYSDISARTAAVFEFILADTTDQTDKKLKKS